VNQITGIHNHTEYSPLDSVATTDDVVKRAIELGMPAISITDHGTLAGHRAFQRSAKQYGIKPILGEELYYAETDRFDRRAKTSRQDGTSVYVHLIALAMNDRGLKNLQAIDREAWLAYYNKPRMDWELLDAYHEDIIFTSACMGGLLSKAIERKDFDYAYEQAKKFQQLLGDRYYIELQGHNSSELNHSLLELADTLKIKPIIAEDSHYADPSQKEMEEIFLILSTHPKMNKSADLKEASKMEILDRLNYLYPDRTMTFQHINLFIGGYELRKQECVAMGIEREDIFANTAEIAERIQDYTYLEGQDTLPSLYEYPDATIRDKVFAGLNKKGLDDKKEYVDRAAYELSVITGKNFSNYFLVLEDAVNWSRKKGIRSGFGRGSAAGSLVCYALDITGIDPLKHNLLFERFLDAERADYPDVDWDIMDTRRGEVKQYLADKYGHVASITNINTYKGKKALKDAARALGIPFAEINKAMKTVQGIDEITGHDVIAEFRTAAKLFCEKHPEVPDIAEKLFGRINGYGMHAAGLVIANKPISEYAPIETRKSGQKIDGIEQRIEVVALDKDECESIGLIKMDLLGLKTLSVVDEAIELIRENRGIVIDLAKINMQDPDVYDMLSKGKTLGVFQCEAAPYTKLLIKMGCSDFNDLVVSNALVRPGAWNAIGEDYIKSKRGIKKAIKIHDDVSYFMDETFSFPVYQEQMMKLSIDLAGFTVGESNALRKGIGKKKRDIIDKFKPKFIEGAVNKVPKQIAEKLWISFEESGAYAFNKSHAVAYSMLSYQTAWLKYHYPLEFMCALIRNEKNNEAVTDYLLECKQMGIKVRLPHINHSKNKFSIEDDALRMGLSNIKYISDALAKRIMDARPFESYADFKDHVLKRGSGLNTRVLSSLNSFGGAAFEDNPRPDDYKKNLYEILGIPAFDTNLITQKMKEQLRPLDEYLDDETFMVMAVVKGIKRGEGWARVDMVDSSGTAGSFADQDIDVVKGTMYLFLIGNNRIMKYINLEDVKEEDEIVMDYLRRPILEEITPGWHKILYARRSTTKTGKKIAHLVVSDDEKNLQTLMVFAKDLPLIRSSCKIGSVKKLTVGDYKGTKFIKDAY
jgi:DNA polymerase-3 subunit alpha